MSCETANYLYNRCPETVSTNCISYQGEPIPCLGICKGSNLSIVEKAIADKVCLLAELTDMSVVDFTALGTCQWISDAWSAAEKDKTIFNILEFILDELCVLNAKIDGLDKPLTVEFPLNYSCCGIPCGGETVFNMPTHLKNIIDCICNLKGEVTALQGKVGGLESDILALSSQLNDPNSSMTFLQCQISAISLRLSLTIAYLNTLKDGEGNDISITIPQNPCIQ